MSVLTGVSVSSVMTGVNTDTSDPLVAPCANTTKKTEQEYFTPLRQLCFSRMSPHHFPHQVVHCGGRVEVGGGSAFIAAAPSLWNALSASSCNAETISIFKSRLIPRVCSQAVLGENYLDLRLAGIPPSLFSLLGL